MSSDAAYQRLAMRIFADFSGTIAVPAVLAALLGKWLDARYGTEPKLLIVCFSLALALTVFMVVRKARFYGKKYQELNQK
ncbi:hypothetical protein A2348_02375 [Candidatus Uhrbacteria bacterium RIFOXYB12_FULL_58_10]|nr:MAG: hypothetical protein A2348_02375 [Candidatus Uhrbacteria bacterium RIFOXYB12_FULL_58_10]OGL99339.1 MAG: hypothetical protein A2501_05360 [Candidatus Uhrbacteria bacterium RIFOXYC12_FULL_57_11]